MVDFQASGCTLLMLPKSPHQATFVSPSGKQAEGRVMHLTRTQSGWGRYRCNDLNGVFVCVGVEVFFPKSEVVSRKITRWSVFK